MPDCTGVTGGVALESATAISSTLKYPLSTNTIHPLLSLPPSSPKVTTFLQSLSPSPPIPQIKSFPEAQYHAYFPLGLDLIYAPKTPTADTSWELDRIDIYNPVPGVTLPQAGTSRRRAPPPYKVPALPISIQLAHTPPIPAEGDPKDTKPEQPIFPDRPEPFLVNSTATGRDFVAGLGEPSRKGGAKGWVAPWLEWTNLRILIPNPSDEDKGEREVGIGLMVELRPTHREPTEEEQKKGMGGVWDQAASWEWSCVKLFRVDSTL